MSCVYQCHVEAEGTFWHLVLTQTFLMYLQFKAVSRIFRHVEQMACHNVVTKYHRRSVAKTNQRNVDPVNNDRMHGAPKGTCSPGGAPRAMTEIG